MNIFLRELKASRKSLIIWSIIVVFFVLVGSSKFSAFYENPELLAILDTLPPAVLSAMSMDAFNLTTATGFFGIMVLYFSLVLAIAAAMWGSGVISKEERDRTVEFTLTLPVTRARLITAKVAAAVVNSLILLLVTWGINEVSARAYAPDAAYHRFVAITMLSLFIIQMIFLALGVFLACALKRHKLPGAISVWVILGAYFLSVLSGLDERLDFIRYISPFKYFEPVRLFHENSLEMVFVLLSVGIVGLLLAGAYAAYRRRDMYI